MARYANGPVPRGTSRRWEVLISAGEGERPARPRRMAIEVLPDHRVLREMNETVLHEIPLLLEGSTLQRLREYLDLHDPARAAFRAEGDEVVRPGQRVVARAEVTPEAWDELCAACDRTVRRRPLPRAS